MSTEETQSQKAGVSTTYQLEATVTDLETQVEHVRVKIDDLDPTGPNGPLRQVRRRTEVNSIATKELRSQIREFEVELGEVKEAIRRLNGLEKTVLEVQGRVAVLEGADG